MQLAILSRWSHLYSTQSLFLAARKAGHYTEILDYAGINTLILNQGIEHRYDGEALPFFDAIIGRISPVFTPLGAALLDQFAQGGSYVTPAAGALTLARDKWQALTQLRAAGVPVPQSAMIHDLDELPLLVEALGGYPVVLKVLEGTHGTGVILARDEASARAQLETFAALNKGVLVQAFVAETGGADIRVLVVGGAVVASMQRTPAPGDFRSNLHQGGSAQKIVLSDEEARVALRATAAVGLEIAGVDLLRSDRGPLVLEVNASPGLEGIEHTTDVDIAGAIIAHLERKITTAT